MILLFLSCFYTAGLQASIDLFAFLSLLAADDTVIYVFNTAGLVDDLWIGSLFLLAHHGMCGWC